MALWIKKLDDIYPRAGGNLQEPGGFLVFSELRFLTFYVSGKVVVAKLGEPQ